jgi:hypothetical protein
VHDGFRTFHIVLRIVAGVVARGDEVYQHHSSTGSSLDESALTSMRVDRFFLRIEEKILPLHGGRRWSSRSPQCTWTAFAFALRKKPCLSMAGVAGVRQLGPCVCVRLPPPGRRRTDLFMERRGRRTGAARWDDSSSLPWNLTLLAGAADNTEEDGRGRGRVASSLQNLPLESRDEEGRSGRRG